MKFPLAGHATPRNLSPQHRPRATSAADGACGGANVGDGDDVVIVEAMKMEIPVSSSAAGKIKSISVAIDDIVAEGQTVAILET